MTGIGFLLVAFSPGLFWLWFFARLDRLRPSSRRWIALTFIFGMVSVFPAAALSFLFISDEPLRRGADLAAVSLSMLAVVGPVEESCKFLAVRWAVFRSLHFEEFMDGLVYGAAASLGFASLENLLYVLAFGPEVMVLRAPFSTLAHLVFGSLWGYGLGLRRSGRGLWIVWVTLAGAAALHGASNILLFSSAPWLSLILTAVGGVCVYRLFKWGQSISPFRYQRNIPLTICRHCGQMIRVASVFCLQCGTRQSGLERAALICGHCRQINRPDARFCTQCGDMLLV